MTGLLEQKPDIRWPAYKPLAVSIRHNLYILPLEAEMQRTINATIDEETGSRLKQTIISEVDRLEAERAE